MKKAIKLFTTLLFLAFIFGCSNSEDENTITPLVISNFSPNQAYSGQTVTILADNINTLLVYDVQFNNISSPLVKLSATQIEAVIPNGNANGSITIKYGDKTTNIGTIEVTEEKAFILTRSFERGTKLITVESGLEMGTSITNVFSDAGKVYGLVVAEPTGAQTFDSYTEIHNFITGERVFRTIYDVLFEKITGDSQGFLYCPSPINKEFLWKTPANDYGTIVGEAMIPEEFSLEKIFYFEDIERFCAIVTIQGQSGRFLWKVNMENGTSETIPLENSMVSIGEVNNEELWGIHLGATNDIVKIDRITGEIAEVLFEDIPSQFVENSIMQSASTNRIFLATHNEIYIINTSTGSRTTTPILQSTSVIWGVVNF